MTFAQRYDRPPTITRKPARQSTVPRIAAEAQPNQQNAQTQSFKAPVGGLMLDVDIASIPDGGSYLMRNVFPLADRVRVRGGAEQRNIGLDGEVLSIAVYETGAARRAFAFTGASAFDITETGAVGSPVLTGLSDAVWNHTTFTTSGATYLVACGAGNSRQLYDGSAWTVSPAITGVAASSLAASWVYANRLFFAEAGTTNAWYLPVDSIGGVAVKFPLGGEFEDGGKILTGGVWSADAGDSPRSLCVFVSTEGDVVVYEGEDPAAWSKRHALRVPKPCGVNCLYRSGGDLLIMTEAGLFALSQIIRTDLSVLINQAVSKGIRPLWRDAAKKTTPARWQMVRRELEGMAIVVPVKAGIGAPVLFPANSETGAWATWDGWDPTCASQFGVELLLGTVDGRIGRGESGGSDYTRPFTAIAAAPFYSKDGRNIHMRMGRVCVRSIETCSPKVAAIFDYNTNEPLAPPVCTSRAGDLWNLGKWNVSQWSGKAVARERWQAITGASSAASLVAMYTIGQVITPNIEIMRFDAIFEIGGVMT